MRIVGGDFWQETMTVIISEGRMEDRTVQSIVENLVFVSPDQCHLCGPFAQEFFGE